MNSKTKRRIGLVDDDEMVRFATGALLQVHEFQVDLFASAESLLESESLNDFDALIIDYRMAGMSGHELLQELKQRSPQIPVLVLSGFITNADISSLTRTGAAAIMNKPVKSDELLAVLTRITREKDAA